MLLVCLAWLPAAGAVHAQVYPGRIASGLGGFGFTPNVGTIGSGASYSGYGYIFIPSVGFVPAYSNATMSVTQYPMHGVRPRMAMVDEPATLDVKLPPGAELRINGHKVDVSEDQYTYSTRPLNPWLNYKVPVQVRWMKEGKPVVLTRLVNVFAGARVRIDYTRVPDAPTAAANGRRKENER
jgi:uncharacterized protein (TIGR03000 family)